jgi:hypothetical protein
VTRYTSTKLLLLKATRPLIILVFAPFSYHTLMHRDAKAQNSSNTTHSHTQIPNEVIPNPSRHDQRYGRKLLIEPGNADQTSTAAAAACFSAECQLGSEGPPPRRV